MSRRSLDLSTAQGHVQAVADSGEAYRLFVGWVLTCSWCQTETRGSTKREAICLMQAHYDDICGPGRVEVGL